MKALVKGKAERGLWLENIPEPTIGINDVLIRVHYTGICGTDVHIYEWDDWARKTIPVPMAIGHEFVGEIVEVGSNVSDFHSGDIVSGEGHVVCGRCRNCLAGRRHLCSHTLGVGVNRPGAFAELISLPMTNIWRHSSGINQEVAAIFDPFGNAVHTALSFPVLGEDVLITGAGPIGLMAIPVVKHAGARHVVVTDLNPHRLELARRMGATLAVNTLTAMCSFGIVAHAQFGSGIVFDPTQSGHAIVQIEHEGQSLANQAQQIENGQQIFTNTVKIAATAIQTYNTVQQQYNLYHQMMLAPQMLYSRFLSPMTDVQMLEQVSNTYGNSAGWVNSANTGNGATASYQQASVPRTSSMVPGYGAVSVTGQQQIAAQGATVDLGDSVMTNNLAVLGTIRANQTSRETDIANLEAATQSQDPSQQTTMAELQRINQILLLQLRTMQDANQINANLALQQIVAQKQQQDTLKAGFQDTANYTNTYQTRVAPAYQGGAQALTY